MTFIGLIKTTIQMVEEIYILVINYLLNILEKIKLIRKLI